MLHKQRHCARNPLSPQGLTLRETIPDLQAVILAVWRVPQLDVKLLKVQDDLRHVRGEDHEGAVQVVGVLLREPWGRDDSIAGGDVPGTFWSCLGEGTHT